MADGIPPKTEIKSQPPDVIVSVGTGDSKQDFECYKVVMAFASPYLDAMLSSEMKEGESGRVEFPMKDPEEWKLFYAFIDPEKIGQRSQQAVIDSRNVLALLPWFHEFQMDDHVKECDEYLAKSYFKPLTSTQTFLEHRRASLDAMLSVLHLADMYDLRAAKEIMDKTFAFDMLNMTPHEMEDMYDLATVKSLLQSIMPLTLEDNKLVKEGEESCAKLLSALQEILSPHIPSLSQEIIDNETAFPVIVYSYMQLWSERKSAKQTKDTATKILNTIFSQYPSKTRYETFQTVLASHFKRCKGDFATLGVDMYSPRVEEV